MKKFLFVFVPTMMVLVVLSFFVVNVSSCRGNSTDGQGSNLPCDSVTSEVVDEAEDGDCTDIDQYDDPLVPAFIKERFGNKNWCADTICMVGGKTYYMAYSGMGLSSIIYDDDKILAYDPTLQIDSSVPGNSYKFYISVIGKTMLTDFSNPYSLKRLSSLSPILPSFDTYSFDSIAGFGRYVSYNMIVDFPNSSAIHSEKVENWIVDIIANSQQADENVPPLNAFYIGYKKKSIGRVRYKGDIHDHKKVAQNVASMYFAITKGEWGTNDEEYPLSLSSSLNLQVKVMNNRFVTYQKYTYDYYGGAHGYYTEKMISYDHVHNQEIDFKYLFNSKCEQQLLDILKNEAKNYPHYVEWKPNIEEFVCLTDENNNPTGELRLPQPGLTNEGVVFSFQPYEISGFAAGTFHFILPYNKIKHLMTPRGKWCVGLN